MEIKTRPIEISGRILARNTLLNFIGQVLQLLVGVGTTPFIVRGLGTERFGLLSLAWVVLGYLTIFNLGLGRATAKFVAEALGKGDEDRVPHLVWTAVTVQAIFGILGAIVLASITPLLVERILNIHPEMLREAKTIFYLLSISIPVMFVFSSFSGILEAAQRFDLVNIVRIPSNISIYLLTLIGLLLGLQLSSIVALILVARFVALLTLMSLNLRLFPGLRRFSPQFVLIRILFSYGGWVTVSGTLIPVIVYLDRFLIASLLSTAMVAYYTAPYEAVTRLGVIPASLTMTLFPAFSALGGSGDRQRLEMLFTRSIKYTLLALGPIILIIWLLAGEILQIWLGSDFAIQSKGVMQILALGMLASSLAQIPYALLQGVGRPDIPAKYHLAELLPYSVVAWFLINRWSITGAAVASTLRLVFTVILLFIIAFKVCRLSLRLFATNGLILLSIVLLLFAGGAYILKILIGVLPFLLQLPLFSALFGLFAWTIWKTSLDTQDRETFLRALKSIPLFSLFGAEKS